MRLRPAPKKDVSGKNIHVGAGTKGQGITSASQLPACGSLCGSFARKSFIMNNGGGRGILARPF